jgi:uncharacterized protein YbcC (UPF0753/DUF2309 family)
MRVVSPFDVEHPRRKHQQTNTNIIMKTLKFALLAIAFAAFPVIAQETHKPMKATKDCGACCKQGGDCCPKCSHDKCAPCCDKKKEAPKK